MGRADLHTHTLFSDGTLTPTELVRRAAEAGLEAVAITDHDSVDGVPEGVAAGERFGVMVVPGVEINTDVPGSEVHVLGYFLDTGSPGLQAALRDQREGRLRRAEQMVGRLNQAGVPVRIERVLELAGDEGAVGRPHVARVIVELGYAADIPEAFDRYLGHGRPGYVPRRKFLPEQAIAVIREAGGVPVLAHPGLSHSDEAIRGWVRAGVRGIEVDHSGHADEQAAHYRRLARDLGLIPTAGSDFHGLPGGQTAPGARTCDVSIVDRLRAEAQRIGEEQLVPA